MATKEELDAAIASVTPSSAPGTSCVTLLLHAGSDPSLHVARVQRELATAANIKCRL